MSASEHRPRYVPFDGRPETISMGLRPLGNAPWLEPDERRDEDLAAKAALLRTRHDDVVATLPLGDDAAAETFDLVADEVHRAGLGPPTAADVLPLGLHPVDAAGRLVQEDLCVMVSDGVRADGGARWVLAAASVCAPSRWVLAEKIGHDLTAIHGPVPDYASIERSTALFFDRISVDRPVWRTNWTLLDEGALFQPTAPASWEPGDEEGRAALAIRPEDVVLRVERQTLRRLPRSQAVLFTIRTYVDRIGTLSPSARADLRGTLAHVPESVVDYRGWHHVLPAVRTWLAAT